jgi:hypothetical protein
MNGYLWRRRELLAERKPLVTLAVILPAVFYSHERCIKKHFAKAQKRRCKHSRLPGAVTRNKACTL